ncbi:hypothetical protein CO046_01305 [Candidatus Peregrinibacteria bacterium CG_4_9_14_0_2_um_filter_53_11]|nr:MAG: hypothetical protein CO046_01305 [Candidatus Peregrinibacteria bacterium CG_4_9_14_0_2_um_filter_53_11]
MTKSPSEGIVAASVVKRNPPRKDYNPTAPVNAREIIRAEVLAAGRDFLNGNPAAVANLAEEVAASLRRTKSSGQPVLGEVLDDKDPVSAVRREMMGVLAEPSCLNEEGELPEGCVRATVGNRVGNGLLVHVDNGGKAMTLTGERLGALKAGDSVVVRRARKPQIDRHGREEVMLNGEA